MPIIWYIYIYKFGGVDPSGRDMFCLKNFDTFTRTPVRVSKMNAVARVNVNFIYIYIYIYILWASDRDVKAYTSGI